MLDDNVQLCHELEFDETAKEGKYQPCSFTHVMDSLERLMLCGGKRKINVKAKSDSNGTVTRVYDYVNDATGASPPESAGRLLRAMASTPPIRSTRNIATVRDLCGWPGHYGIIGISRHGYGCRNSKSTTEPFDVTHSLYSFCLLNVRSTVVNGASYPMKQYAQDIEFNHIVDEKGLVVCKYRKFSHSKKNLQPIQTRQPGYVWRPPCPSRPFAPDPLPPVTPSPCPSSAPSPASSPSPPQQHPWTPHRSPIFEHIVVDLAALQQKYEGRRNACLVRSDQRDALLTYLSQRVLTYHFPVKEVLHPTEDHMLRVAEGKSFEIEPASPTTDRLRIDLAPVDNYSRSSLIVLLGGILNESFGVLKKVISDQVSAISSPGRRRIFICKKTPFNVWRSRSSGRKLTFGLY